MVKFGALGVITSEPPGSNFVLKRSAAFLRAEKGGPQRINTAAEHAAEQAVENAAEVSAVEASVAAEHPAEADLQE